MEITSAGLTDTYFSFFLNRPFWQIWNLFLLGLARLVPIIALAPFLGGKIVADPIKIGFGVVLVILFLPYILATSNAEVLNFDLTFIFYLVKEVVIGSILGFLISIPFFYAQSAGSLIDHQRGSQSLQVTDPSSSTQVSPIGLLYNNMMIVIFFAIGGPFLFFEAVFTSYQILPPDGFFGAAFFSKQSSLFHLVLNLLNSFVTISLQLSAPSLIALLMSDLFLGIANRMAPQVQISFLLWSLKAYIGIALLWAAWWFILKQMDVLALDWVKTLAGLIETLKY